MNDEIAPNDMTLEFKDNEILQNLQFTLGSMLLKWSATDRINIDITGSSNSGVIHRIGFSFGLPPGDISNMHGELKKWDVYKVGDKVFLDELYMTLGQFILLKGQDFCIRIGRQVEKKRDYTIGYFEKNEKGWLLFWIWEPQTPYPMQFESQQLQIKYFDSVENALEEHRVWMEDAFQLTDKMMNPRVPEWFKGKCSITKGTE